MLESDICRRHQAEKVIEYKIVQKQHQPQL